MLPTCPLPPGRTIRRWVLTANLGNLLIGASKTFTGFSEDLPSADPLSALPALTRASTTRGWISPMCKAPATTLYEFSTNFTTLPTISFVIPNLNDDMHDGTISQADTLASWDED